MRWTRRAVGGLATCLGLTMGAGSSRAEPGSPAAAGNVAETRRVVLVAGKEYGRDIATLCEAVVSAHAPDVHVVFVEAGSAEDPAVSGDRGGVWLALDTSVPSRWRLTLTHRGRARFRDLGGVDGDAAAVEATALMAARAILAMLHAEEEAARAAELGQWRDATKEPKSDAGESPIDAPRREPKRDEPRARRVVPSAPQPIQPSSDAEIDMAASSRVTERRPGARTSEAEVFLAYRGAVYAAEHPWTSGVHLRGAWRSGAGPGLGLGVTYFPELGIESALGDFRVTRVPVELSVEWRFEWERWALVPGLAGVVEPTWRSGTLPEPGVGVSPERILLGWGFVGALAVDYSLLASLGVRLRAGAEVFVQDVRFRSGAEDSTDILTPFPMRPRIDLGAVWTLP